MLKSPNQSGVVRSLALLTTGLIVSSLGISPARAEGEPQPELAAIVAAQQAHGAKIEAAANAIEPHLVRNEETGTIAIPASLEAQDVNVSEKIFGDVESGLVYTNKLIANGILESNSNFDVYPAEEVYGAQSTYSHLYAKWWGLELHLSDYVTQKVVAGGNTVAAIAALICTFAAGCGGPGYVLAGIIAVAANVIDFCSNSRGVVLKRNHLGMSWCHGH